MAFVPLIKIGVVLAVLVALVWAIHSNGRSVERGVCAQSANEKLEERRVEMEGIAAQLETANKQNALLAATNSKLISEVTARAETNLTAAVAADAALRRDPAGLRVPTATCRTTSSSAVPSTSGGAEVDHGTGRDGGVRLPEGIETGLYDLTYQANRTRIKRDECRDFALGLEKMREEWERAQRAGTD